MYILLGARVEAFDTRPAVEEQVRSLGARFVRVDLGETGETEQGYARELTVAQLATQREACDLEVGLRSDLEDGDADLVDRGIDRFGHGLHALGFAPRARSRGEREEQREARCRHEPSTISRPLVCAV